MKLSTEILVKLGRYSKVLIVAIVACGLGLSCTTTKDIPGTSLPRAQMPVSKPIVLVPDRFVLVEGGSFLMGGRKGEFGQRPEHGNLTTVRTFLIEVTDVTQAGWEKVMETNPSNFVGVNRPVEQVSWYDAIAYCNKRSVLEGLDPAYALVGTDVTWDQSANGYRLPTEAEWEYAARGGTKDDGEVYSGSWSIKEVAWFAGNSGSTVVSEIGGSTRAVALMKPNRLGLYDMSGNVWQWCFDQFHDDTNVAEGPDANIRRTFRGGSWLNDAKSAMVTSRGKAVPSLKANYVGFRVARNEKLVYKIGDVGPGDGIVFYDKGNYSEGWRYLEVSRQDLGSFAWDDAFVACRALSDSDQHPWHLPSQEELELVFQNLAQNDPTGFSSNYWSASEIGGAYAWFVYFADGQQVRGIKRSELPVRAIRSF